MSKPVWHAIFKIDSFFFFFSKNQDNETCLSAHLVRIIDYWNKICVVTNYGIKIIILLLIITIHFSKEILKTTRKQKHPKKEKEKKTK